LLAATLATSALTACGGGGGSSLVTPATFDLQAGISHLVTSGQSSNVTLSGSVVVNGTSTPISGSGTLTLTAGTMATFNATAALAQTETISGTVTAAGQSAPYSVTVVDYYASSSDDFLGEVESGEYDVASTPFTYPATVMGGSSGSLGTVNRYTDSSMGVALGTVQVGYTVTAGTNPSGPVTVAITSKIYDTQNNLTETDVTSYSLTSGGVLSLVSATAQNASGSIDATAQ